MQPLLQNIVLTDARMCLRKQIQLGCSSLYLKKNQWSPLHMRQSPPLISVSAPIDLLHFIPQSITKQRAGQSVASEMGCIFVLALSPPQNICFSTNAFSPFQVNTIYSSNSLHANWVPGMCQFNPYHSPMRQLLLVCPFYR